ncbi:MAG TPA: UTP--glucose-1-phosphate uridylyltransferase [Ilumatobacteraceae bacterium]|nr:UTP--glucose-1-phosphate uridylyltransferase [Ilumatobacteraceae bacterium]
MHVRTAVIPAAGLGTRFLPATKAVPKELLPIIDTPALQLIIDEAVGAGIDRIVIVTSASKPSIEAYFQPSDDVLAKLRHTGRDQLAERLESIGRDVQVEFVIQDAPLGLGHAVGCAAAAVGDEPFAVLLPDELMGDSSLLDQMARLCESTAGSVVGLKRVPAEQVSSYGVIEPASEMDASGVIAICDMVEKPKVEDAPSDLIIIGRYVLTPDVFAELEQVQPGSGGEIQLTDALRAQAAKGPFHGVLSTIARYDTGTPLGWLCAVVDIALADAVLAAEFRPFLSSRLTPLAGTAQGDR